MGHGRFKSGKIDLTHSFLILLCIQFFLEIQSQIWLTAWITTKWQQKEKDKTMKKSLLY